MSTTPVDAIDVVVREHRTRILATLIRVTGDVGLAEDAVHDAVVRALETWPRDGVPDEPRAWLTTVARRCAIDRLRRETARDHKEADAVWTHDRNVEPPPPSVVRDDLLRLVFTCCHPSLSIDAQVALSLRTLCGLTTAEVARALVVSEATMNKRLTRARQKIRQARIPYRVPPDDELPERLVGVLATVYLVFNEGYAAGSGATAVRQPLVDEALRLGRLLHDVMPDEPSVSGLLALMLIQDSRRVTRVSAAGDVVLLAEQDRSRWDQSEIRVGVELVGDALRRGGSRPDSYVIQGAIAACHALAPSYAETDWSAVISWYDLLIAINDSPVTRLGRAAAVAERDGEEAGLTAVDSIDGLENYAWWYAVRAELLYRLGREDEALASVGSARRLGLNEAHLRHLERGRATPPPRTGRTRADATRTA